MRAQGVRRQRLAGVVLRYSLVCPLDHAPEHRPRVFSKRPMGDQRSLGYDGLGARSPLSRADAVRALSLRAATLLPLALLGLSCDSALASSSRPACAPRGATILASGPDAAIYALASRQYGCTLSQRLPVALNTTEQLHGHGSERLSKFRLSGTVVAYSSTSCGVDTCRSAVLVRQLSDGRLLRAESAFDGRLPPEGISSVTAIVLRGSAVGWIGKGSSLAHSRRMYEVHRVDSAGSVTLDAGTGIGPRSLKLHGPHMSWRHAGHTRSAPLT